MTMTLEQVLSWHRSREKVLRGVNSVAHKDMADAIDAHLAGMGEPAAWANKQELEAQITRKQKPGCITVIEVADHRSATYTEPLYTAPPIDVAAVREVIAEMHGTRVPVPDDLLVWADKLEAAIKRAARRSHG